MSWKLIYLSLEMVNIEPICGIYVITNKINGHQYVGLSVNCQKRWSDHKNKALHPNKPDDYVKPLYMAMKKYGVENFEFKILEECLKEELPEKEKYWIQKLDSFHNGYNATPGGELPGPNTVHLGERHGRAKLTDEEVIQCRKWYAEGRTSREIWELYFKDRIKYSSFSKMWHGKNWKHIMPEVFENNPHPRQKFSEEIKQQVKNMYNNQHMTCAEIYHYFNKEISRTTINDWCNNKR